MRDHPITIEPARARLRVVWRGRVVADTAHALVLREASYPPVHYVPRVKCDFEPRAASFGMNGLDVTKADKRDFCAENVGHLGLQAGRTVTAGRRSAKPKRGSPGRHCERGEAIQYGPAIFWVA